MVENIFNAIVNAFKSIVNDFMLFVSSFIEGIYKGVLFSAAVYFILFLASITGRPEDFVELFKQIAEGSTQVSGLNEFKEFSFEITKNTAFICVAFFFGCLAKNYRKRGGAK